MMCLDIVYKGKTKKVALAKLPESGYYWKTVIESYDGYYPICNALLGSVPFESGWNKTKIRHLGYDYKIAFHLHRYRKGAEGWSGRIVRCIIKKKDIVAIGLQNSHLTIVTKRFWIPKPKKKSA